MATTPVTTQARPNKTCTPNTANKNGESDGISMPATLIGLSTIMLTCLLYLYWPALHQRTAELRAHTPPVLPALACARSFQAIQCERNRGCPWQVVQLLPGRSWYRASPTATASDDENAANVQSNPRAFQSLFDRLRSAHSDGAALTLHKTINVNRYCLCSFLLISHLWEGDSC